MMQRIMIRVTDNKISKRMINKAPQKYQMITRCHKMENESTPWKI